MSFRAGFLTFVGLPNAGKSSLLNRLIGEKISIVSPKPQTTRQRVVGLISRDDYQLAFVDAPGAIDASQGLNGFLSWEYQDSIRSSDALVAILNVDANDRRKLERVIETCVESKKPWMAVIHKTDLNHKNRELALRGLLSGLGIAVQAISSQTATDEDILELEKTMSVLVPESAGPMYDPDNYALSSMKDLCSEMIRESCFENLHHEIPFQTAVRIRKFDESNPKITKIYSDVLVAKEAHKPILIGQSGSQLKKIGMASRASMEKLLGTKVFLEIKVQVRPNWARNPELMKELGYVAEPGA